jgi:hypothetical protein
VYGFGGVRYFDSNLTLTPTPIDNTTALTLIGLRRGSAVLDAVVTPASLTVTLRDNTGGAAVCMACGKNGADAKPLVVGTPVSVALATSCAITLCATLV